MLSSNTTLGFNESRKYFDILLDSANNIIYNFVLTDRVYSLGDELELNKTEVKLTQTYTTEYCTVNKECEEVPDGYMVISSYYLWFLIDTFNFKIEDIKYLLIFSKHDKFNYFVNECMTNRCKAILENGKDSAEELSYKIFMNSSYGFDSLDSSRFKTGSRPDHRRSQLCFSSG